MACLMGLKINIHYLFYKNDSDGDKDSDGLSNLLEFQTGTNPANADTDGDGLNDSVDAKPLTPSSIPALSGVPDEQIEQGAEYSFTPTLDYPGDVNTVQFSIENKPDWASFSEQNGLLLGKPKNDHVGQVSNIVISASNGFTTDSLDPFNIEVINVNDPPILLEAVTINGGSVLTSTAISTDLNSYFDDPDTGDSLTFTVADLPDGLTLSDQGVIAGNVSTVGQFTIVITVTDNAGASITANASLNVTAPSSSNAPVSQSSGGGALPIYGLLLLLGAICFKNKKLIWSRHSR